MYRPQAVSFIIVPSLQIKNVLLAENHLFNVKVRPISECGWAMLQSDRVWGFYKYWARHNPTIHSSLEAVLACGSISHLPPTTLRVHTDTSIPNPTPQGSFQPSSLPLLVTSFPNMRKLAPIILNIFTCSNL